MGAGQMGFAEALLGGKAGQNRRLERIERLIDRSAIEAMLPPATPPGPGRPAYPSRGEKDGLRHRRAILAMFKGLRLAKWYQLSDPALEEALCVALQPWPQLEAGTQNMLPTARLHPELGSPVSMPYLFRGLPRREGQVATWAGDFL
jgi:hypothetical protein